MELGVRKYKEVATHAEADKEMIAKYKKGI